jgi:hypothetical protein
VRVVLSGSIGRLPVGGHAWIDMQYLAGLRDLGHDVYYLEDAGDESWVYDWVAEELTTDLGYPAGYVADCLRPLGLEDRWCYRTTSAAAGLSIEQMNELLDDADLLLIRAVPLEVWRQEYDRPRRRAFIDSDPGFTQISLVQGHRSLSETTANCESLFTFAQRLGASDCPIPDAGRRWHRTVAPVCLPLWPAVPAADPAAPFTCVMQWRGFREVEFDGVRYGQKDLQFGRYVDVPRLTGERFRLALTGKEPAELVEHGWEVVAGWVPSRTPTTYRDFIAGSRGEFGVAKHGYVAMRGGWFSDRSVCYLATGRPVVVEDTGLGDWLPTGAGVLPFSDVAGAVDAIADVQADYRGHSDAARRLAEEVFDARRVLSALLEVAAD